MIRAVVLDLDDTLCMTEAISFEMENEALAQLGREPMPREVHLSTWGMPVYDAIAVRSPGADVEKFKELLPPIIARSTEEGRLDAISPENLEALDQLVVMGKQLIILTSRTHGELSHLLEPDHLLAERIKAFYYRDNMEFHKPDPRAFEQLLKDAGISPSEAAYVGDSIGDAEAAKGAGLHFVASLESGLRAEEDFAHLPVDIFIPTFPDIVDAIKQLDEAA